MSEKETRPSFEGTKKEKISPEAEKAEPEAKSAEAKRRRERKLFELMDEAEKAETTPEKTKILREMKEVVGEVGEEKEEKEEKELPPERRLSPEEKRKIDEVIKKTSKGQLDIEGLDKAIESLGEKIVEPFLDKLESFEDEDFKKRPMETYCLISGLEITVKPRDAERLVNLLLRDPVAHNIDRANKDKLVMMLGKVGDEKVINKLVEYSLKVIETPYGEGRIVSSKELKTLDQSAVKRTLLHISARETHKEIDEEKINSITRKIEQALDIIDRNIESIKE